MTTTIETMLIKLAPVIAKSILALWTRDSEISPNFAADAIGDFTAYFQSRTQDAVAQRRAARYFVDIGDRVIENLYPLIEVEAKNLDDGSIQTIITLVSDLLQHTLIDSRVLAERNLDPVKLKDYLVHSSLSSIELLSRDETAIYKLILSECSQYIVDIASRLPSFTERTFAEVLKRDDKILEIVTQILTTVKNIRETSRIANDDNDSAYFESEYRRNVGRKLGQVHLFGVDSTIASSKYDLTLAYITLMVTRHGKLGKTDTNYLSIERHLSASSKVLVRGNPGSGKTTLAQWIAVCAATNDFPVELDRWNNRVPFLIRLRDFANTSLPIPDEWVRILSGSLAGAMPAKWVSKTLYSGRAIVLIDGYDEIPTNQRAKVTEWIQDLVENFPNVYYIVTSRSYAASPFWLSQNGFTSAELQPMKLTAIDEFIVKWHMAVKNELSDEAEKEEIISLAHALKQTIRQNRSIRELATNPLLCAMICALHRDRYRQLPTRRVSLYEAACKMLLEDRDKRRNISTDQYPRLDYDQKRAILKRLAYWQLRNRKTIATRQEVEYQFAISLRNLQNLPNDATTDRVYELLAERSGIVREPETGILDFAHRTFLEYLAAVAVIDEHDLGFLVKNAHDEQWREVITLSAGIGDLQTRHELISMLLDKGDAKPSQSTIYYLLAAMCVEAAIEIDEMIKSRVEKTLVSLIPPSSAKESTNLVSVGKLAIPFLENKPTYNSRQAAMCLKTLVGIRGDLALDALNTYRSDKREPVLQELVLGWRAFDTSKYAQSILHNFAEIDLEGEFDLLGLKWLKHLVKLRISRNSTLEKVPSMNHMTKLSSLIITDCHSLINLEGISDLQNLRSLDISGCLQIRDLKPIATLKSLEKLALFGCQEITDLSAISKLNHLRYLDIRNCDWINDLSPLVDNANLETLVLNRETLQENIDLLKAEMRYLKLRFSAERIIGI